MLALSFGQKTQLSDSRLSIREVDCTPVTCQAASFGAVQKVSRLPFKVDLEVHDVAIVSRKLPTLKSHFIDAASLCPRRLLHSAPSLCAPDG